MKILIVDDEAHIRKDLGTELETRGHEVFKASSVKEALKFVSNSSYDCAIIDMKLDVTSEYGGIEVFRLARQSIPKIVVLSAHQFHQVAEYGRGMTGTGTEMELMLNEIGNNYIYKGSETNYIEAVLRKLGLSDDPSVWYGDYHALLIAVQDYKMNGIKQLMYPIDDANRLKKILNQYYVFKENNIEILENPSRRNIISKLYSLGEKLTHKDNLIIFYAGHGCWNAEREQGYWLPIDAAFDNPANWISNGDIRDFIRGIKTKHTLLISDACFSGAILKSRGAPNNSKTIQEKYSTTSRKAITSGSSTQVVPDRSIFLEYLINSLKSNFGKPLYAQKLYTNLCDEFINNNLSEQNPVYGSIQYTGDEIGGDFIFISK